MELNITFFRALKIFWSFAWRGLVLTILVVMPVEAIIFAFLVPTMPKPGEKPDAHAVQQMFWVMTIVWPILMAIIVCVQTQAVRWMIRKARWSDFRLALVPREPGSIPDAPAPVSTPIAAGPRPGD